MGESQEGVIAVWEIVPQQHKVPFGFRGFSASPLHPMPKAKTNSTDRVRCACGCGNVLSRRQQTRHLQARGPVMAVAGVIETRAYFHKRDPESPELVQPRKRQKLQTPTPEGDSAQQPMEQVTPQDYSPSATPALPRNPDISRVAYMALSTPWSGLADFRGGDDDIFEDSNDIDYEAPQPTPVSDPTELESSDTDSDLDVGASESDRGEVPDIFETNADLNTEEYSEYTIVSSFWRLVLILTQHTTTLVWTTLNYFACSF